MTTRPEGENPVPPQDTGAVPPDQKPVDEPTEIRNRLSSAAELFQAELARWQEIQPCLEKRQDIKNLVDAAPNFLKIGGMFTSLLKSTFEDKRDFSRFLESGFGTGKFHDLFFLETILTQYQSEDPNWQRIADVVRNMSKIVKDLLAFDGITIDDNKPLSQPAKGAREWGPEYPHILITKIPEVRSSVENYSQNLKESRFVVAAPTTGYVLPNGDQLTSNVILYHSIDWSFK